MQNHHDEIAINPGGEQGILDAAEILFAEKGFDAVSMSAIAKLANTSKPNIYHHFKNKNELYLAIMKTAVQRSSVLLDALEDYHHHFLAYVIQVLLVLEPANLQEIIEKLLGITAEEVLQGASVSGAICLHQAFICHFHIYIIAYFSLY